MLTSTSGPAARVAAVLLSAGLGAIALLHAAWAAGMTWGLDEASGGLVTEWSIGLCVVSVVVVALCVLAIVVALARAGLRPTRLPDRVVHAGAWVIFAALVFGVLANAGGSTDWERFGNAGVALVLAIPALVLARSRPPASAARGRHPPITGTPVPR